MSEERVWQLSALAGAQERLEMRRAAFLEAEGEDAKIETRLALSKAIDAVTLAGVELEAMKRSQARMSREQIDEICKRMKHRRYIGSAKNPIMSIKEWRTRMLALCE